MRFNSFLYIFLFLPIAAGVFLGISRMGSHSLARLWLVASSLCFLAYGGLGSLSLLLFSIAVNYAFISFIGVKQEKKRFSQIKAAAFAFGILFNLSLLSLFKFLGQVIGDSLPFSHFSWPDAHPSLPLGVSFYTFQQIAFLVDFYKGRIKPAGFLDYCLFVSFFPKLIAGPIVRYNEIVPQFDRERQTHMDYRQMSLGLSLIFLGLCKRVMLADTLGTWANCGYENAPMLSAAESWLTSLSYTMQIYFDFSGYTDMALGSAYFFNIRLPPNFDSPYHSANVREFWRRWHMSLSRFLRDYVFIPLGGNRKGLIRTCVNTFITFLVGGIWHGAAWTFLIWGAMHGVAAVVHRLFERKGFNLPKALAIALTLLFVNTAWVFFRSGSIQEAFYILRGMVGLNAGIGYPVFASLGVAENLKIVVVGCLAIGVLCGRKNSNRLIDTFLPSKKGVCFLVLLIFLGMLFLNSGPSGEFLYFDF